MGEMAPDLMPIIWRENSDPAVYEEARVGRVFNAIKPARYPKAVVEATSSSHVIEAVQLANKLGIRVSVRSGGHSWAAWSVREDAILLCLKNLREIDFDESKGIVKCSPSTTGRMLNGFLLDRGYMFGGGHCPDVGLGGFLLQGGMGWNCKNWGWACEQVEGIDVVTADGQMLHCSASENSDLFWAARGSGPGFPAIVTRFYLKTRKAFTNMLESTFIYPISLYRPVMDWITKLAPTSDPGNEIVAVGIQPQGFDQICMLIHVVSFQNTEAAAIAALKPINDTHPPGAFVEAQNQPTSLPNEYIGQDAANPPNHRYCSDNAYVSNDANVTDVLEEAFTTMPHKKSQTLWFSMNPCSRRTNMPDMALSMQSDHYFASYTIWDNETDDARCKAWVKKVAGNIAKHSVGAYLGDSDFQVRKTKFWGDEQGEKLMAIRRKWDPKGTICGYLDEADLSGVQGLPNKL